MANFGTAIFSAMAGTCFSCVALCATEIPEKVLVTNGMQAPRIVEIRDVEAAKLAVIDAGLNSRLRAGVKCVSGEESEGKLVIVDATLEKSVALVLNGTMPKTGDRVYITPAN